MEIIHINNRMEIIHINNRMEIIHIDKNKIFTMNDLVTSFISLLNLFSSVMTLNQTDII